MAVPGGVFLGACLSLVGTSYASSQAWSLSALLSSVPGIGGVQVHSFKGMLSACSVPYPLPFLTLLLMVYALLTDLQKKLTDSCNGHRP